MIHRCIIGHNEGRLVTEAPVLYRFNFCPTCGRALDHVRVDRGEPQPENNPRVRILDASQPQPVALPVVRVTENPDGSLLFVGDAVQLD